MAQTTPPGYDTPLTDADVRPDRAEGGGGILNALTTTQSEGQSPLDKAIEAHHQRRLHEAQMNRDNASLYAATLMHGFDPKTGKELTPEQTQMYKNMRDAAQTAYEKSAGVNKDTKGVLQQARIIVDHLIHHGRQQRGLPPLDAAATGASAATPAAAGATTPDAGIQAPTGGTAPTPGADNTLVSGSGGGTAPSGGYGIKSTAPQKPTPPPAPQAATPQQGQTPPPAYDAKTAALEAPELRRMLEERSADDRKFAEFSREKEVEHKNRMEELANKSHKYMTKEVDDPDAPGQKKLVAYNPYDPNEEAIEIRGSNGEPLRPGAKASANEGKLELVGGVPTGRVFHAGKGYVAPGQPGYTDTDKAAVDAGFVAQGIGQKEKIQIQQIRAAALARERAAYGVVSVVDDVGTSTYATPLDIIRHPGMFTQTNEAEKIATREAVHNSLKANFNALEQSLEALPSGLDVKTQAIVESALRTDNPGMLETLINNQITAHAPSTTIDYLTNIKAAQEDVLVLRTVGGMGQGSDMMRGAMMRLVVGPTTGSVTEGKMQMKAARRTMESLFAGRPHAAFATKPTAPPEPESKARYTEGEKKWDIPLGQEKEFLQEHPNAKRQ